MARKEKTRSQGDQIFKKSDQISLNWETGEKLSKEKERPLMQISGQQHTAEFQGQSVHGYVFIIATF